MKDLGKKPEACFALIILTALLSANSYAYPRDRSDTNIDPRDLREPSSVARDLPENSFACQVQAKNGLQGLVLVQTDNRKMAFDSASNSIASTLNGRQSATIAVVECIKLPEGRFIDSTFQKFFENTPL